MSEVPTTWLFVGDTGVGAVTFSVDPSAATVAAGFAAAMASLAPGTSAMTGHSTPPGRSP